MQVSGGIRLYEDDSEDQSNFEKGRELAIDAWGKGPVSGDQDDHNGHDHHEDVTAKNDDRHPPRDFLFVRQDDEGRRKQQLVSNRIEISSQRRTLIESARQPAIEEIGQTRHNEHQQSPLVAFVRYQREKYRQKSQTQQRDLIGYCPNA